jgi:DNA-binding NarL/FixJ family response regulator
VTAAVALPRPGSALLTDTDRALIQMLALGLDHVDVARRYHLAHAAALLRVKALLCKTGTEDVEQLVRTARLCGWTGPAPRRCRRSENHQERFPQDCPQGSGRGSS